MIDAIASLIRHLSEIITEVGVRMGYNYAEIADNTILGGGDTQTYYICNQWDMPDGLGHTVGYRYWVDVMGNDPSTVPVGTLVNCGPLFTPPLRHVPPSSVIHCPSCCPCCDPFGNPDHMAQFVGDLGVGTVLGNLMGFPFLYNSGKLIVDIGNIIEQLAEAMRSLG